jgi:hypothetical protein
MLSAFDEGGRSLQKVSVRHFWSGGLLGAEHDWNQPENWYNRTVPGWYDEVVISCEYASDFFPVIDIFANDIAQLTVEKGASFIIGPTGRLSIDGLGKKRYGILNEGEITVLGELTIQRTTHISINNFGTLENNGSLALDREGSKGILQQNKGCFINHGEILYLT